MDKRIAVVGIVVIDKEHAPTKVNEILHNAKIIVGRMGLPYKEKGVSIISIIVDGTNDEIGALTGKLGTVAGVKVKVAVAY